MTGIHCYPAGAEAERDRDRCALISAGHHVRLSGSPTAGWVLYVDEPVGGLDDCPRCDCPLGPRQHCTCCGWPGPIEGGTA